MRSPAALVYRACLIVEKEADFKPVNSFGREMEENGPETLRNM